MDTRAIKWTPEFRKEWNREYNRKNKAVIAAKRKANNEDRRLYNLKWRTENREAFNKRQQEYRAKRRAAGIKQKRYHTLEKDRIWKRGAKYQAWVKGYQKRAIVKIRHNRRTSNARNRPHINAARRLRTATDPVFKIAMNCRSRLGTFFREKGLRKNSKAMELLGVPSWEFLKQHLESQFKEGMTWENHSFYGWHIDHIIPLAHFDLRDTTQLMKAFHYSNLQPLWATPNWIKGGRGKKVTVML